jgi:hypothetical protein
MRKPRIKSEASLLGDSTDCALRSLPLAASAYCSIANGMFLDGRASIGPDFEGTHAFREAPRPPKAKVTRSNRVGRATVDGVRSGHMGNVSFRRQLTTDSPIEFWVWRMIGGCRSGGACIDVQAWYPQPKQLTILSSHPGG